MRQANKLLTGEARARQSFQSLNSERQFFCGEAECAQRSARAECANCQSDGERRSEPGQNVFRACLKAACAFPVKVEQRLVQPVPGLSVPRGGFRFFGL